MVRLERMSGYIIVEVLDCRSIWRFHCIYVDLCTIDTVHGLHPSSTYITFDYMRACIHIHVYRLHACVLYYTQDQLYNIILYYYI